MKKKKVLIHFVGLYDPTRVTIRLCYSFFFDHGKHKLRFNYRRGSYARFAAFWRLLKILGKFEIKRKVTPRPAFRNYISQVLKFCTPYCNAPR